MKSPTQKLQDQLPKSTPAFLRMNLELIPWTVTLYANRLTTNAIWPNTDINTMWSVTEVGDALNADSSEPMTRTW